MSSLLYGEILERDLLNATFFDAASGARVKADYAVVFHYLFMRHFQIAGVLLLMVVMGVTLGMFLVFHLYITSVNLTTNEYFKWRCVRRWHKKERQKYTAAMKSGMTAEKCDAMLLSRQVQDDDVGCVGTSAGGPPSDIIADDVILDPGECHKKSPHKHCVDVVDCLLMSHPPSFRPSSGKARCQRIFTSET